MSAPTSQNRSPSVATARRYAMVPLARRTTRQKRPVPSEAALYRAVAEATGYVVACLDAAEASLIAESGWEKYTGQSIRHAIGTGFLDAFEPADRERLLQNWARLGDQQELHTDMRVRVWHAESGRYRTCSFRLQPIQPAVVPTRCLLLLRDLEQDGRRKAPATDPRQPDEVRMDALRALARGVAHQVNNLLHGILLQAEVIRSRLEPGSVVQQAALQIVRSTERGAEFSRQLLAFAGAKMSQGQAELSSVIGSIEQVLASLCGAGVDLRLTLGEHLGNIAADAASLRQVALTLVQNASEALGDLPGTISVLTIRRHLTLEDLEGLQTARPGSYLCLEVADTGPGISPHLQPQIFEPFFANKHTGRGLGLPAALGMVRLWGGFIQIASAPGIRTCVRVIVPDLTPQNA